MPKWSEMKITGFKKEYWNRFSNTTKESMKCSIFQPGIKLIYFYYQAQKQKIYLEKATCF